jgi:hypothetical protein
MKRLVTLRTSKITPPSSTNYLQLSDHPISKDNPDTDDSHTN